MALTFFCAYITIKSTFAGATSSPKPTHIAEGSLGSEKRKDVTIMKGVVERYSEKKEWGTIAVHNDSDSESDVETRVRFLRRERDRIDLKPGDKVIFRAVEDQMDGWQLAETIWKAPDRRASEPQMRQKPRSSKEQMD